VVRRDRPSSPPVAKQVPVERVRHGDTVVDPYTWLQVKDDPEVLAHLEAENAFTARSMAHTEALQATLFEEIKARILETDLSVPVRKGGWWWYSRTEEGKQYGIHCRKPAAAPAGGGWSDDVPGDDVEEHVVLDENVEAGEAEFFSVGAFDASPTPPCSPGRATPPGRGLHDALPRPRTGEELPDVIEGTYYGTAWGADGRTFFYTRPDDAMRPHQVWRHVLGTPVDDDVLVHQEDDERFFVGVGTTKDERFLVLGIGSKVTSEQWVLEADDPTGGSVWSPLGSRTSSTTSSTTATAS
jgi:oligopeptidase B